MQTLQISHDRLRAAVAEDIRRKHNWQAIGRPDQLPPPDPDWDTWLILAGRGWGKTRTGAEWCRTNAMAGLGPGALVAPIAADLRDVLVEGPAGILAISPPNERPVYEPSKRRLTWPNGVTATLFSADEPDRLRGPQHAWAWLDEFAAYPDAAGLWDMMQFGLRLGQKPRALVTTTPRPIPALKNIMKMSGTRITRGATRDNRANLAPQFVAQIETRYAGTRLGRQELDGEILDDLPGALWSRDDIDRTRTREAPDLQRIVVAIDPSGTSGSDEGDSIGIVVAGLGVDGRGYVLADRSCKLSPDGWGRRAVEAYHEFEADRIVAERNFGGAMVEHVIRTVDASVSYREVTASRGKVARAEPVAALYEQGRVSHVGAFSALEDQMSMMGSDGFAGEGSPDRLDAMVWALTDLMLTNSRPAILDYYKKLAQEG